MRLVTYQDQNGSQRAGAFIEEDQLIVDLASAYYCLYTKSHNAFSSILALIEAGESAWETAKRLIQQAPVEAVIKRSSVKVLAPIQPPPQMRDCSCFELHLQQCFAASQRARVANAPDPEKALKELDTRIDDNVIKTFKRQPIYYKCNRFAVVGQDQDVIWPSYSKVLDFELEFACYISKKVRVLSKENAKDAIFGFTIFNDISARDTQAREMPGFLGPAKSKDFDTGNVMGPCLVTADEIEDPYNLKMTARVNGEEWGSGNTKDMFWKFEDVIAHISQGETLYPGEVLGSGTVGNGCGLEQMRYLQPGDHVELEIEKIGILASHIVKPKDKEGSV